MKLPSLYAEWR